MEKAEIISSIKTSNAENIFHAKNFQCSSKKIFNIFSSIILAVSFVFALLGITTATGIIFHRKIIFTPFSFSVGVALAVLSIIIFIGSIIGLFIKNFKKKSIEKCSERSPIIGPRISQKDQQFVKDADIYMQQQQITEKKLSAEEDEYTF